MPVFDFHCHPSLKPITAPPSVQPTPWDYLKARMVFRTPVSRTLGINHLFNSALNSQSNLTQLFEGQVNLVGVALYAMEKNMAVGILKNKIAAEGKINLLDPDILKAIAQGTDYYKWMRKSIDLLLNNKKPPAGMNVPSQLNFKFINSINQYVETDLTTIHGIAVVEGVHSFCNDPYSNTAEADFTANLNDFIQRYAAEDVRIFACNLTHLQPFPFGTHASGMQFIEDWLFYPAGTGLSPLGKTIIRQLHAKGILLDVKHLGYSARRAYYEERTAKNYKLPIICTHAGVTGISWNDRLKFLRSTPRFIAGGDDPQKPVGSWQIEHLKPLGHVKEPNGGRTFSAYNTSSIGLYDEDILEILKSDGLIGISLDQRIIGYPAESIGNKYDIFPSDVEFISPADVDFFNNRVPTTVAPREVASSDREDVLTGQDAEDHDQLLFDSHARYFLNQIVHILVVAKSKGKLAKALNAICIGSDFDGMINSIDCCPSSDYFDELKDRLRKLLNERNIWKGSTILKREISVDKLLDDLFFYNAFNFLKKYFK